MINKVTLGDMLVESDNIEDGSVDLILTDLPYGMVEGLGGDIERYKRLSQSTWDNIIPTEKVMEIANRILRKNGKMVLFAQQPFTTELISKTIPNLPHSYNMYWDKQHFANALIANKAPVSYMEDVLVFSKEHDFEGLHPLREYFRQVLKFIGLPKVRIMDTIGQQADHTFRINSSQFALCTEETYKELIKVYLIDKMDGFKEYQELRDVDKGYDAVFNLWDGKKHKSNILSYPKDYDGYHPTQKPILLLEDLIKTFSNEGDLVVDLTAGSGSTAVAAVNTRRDFLAIEMNEEYHRIATERIDKAVMRADGSS